MTDETKFDAMELMARVHDGLVQVGNKSEYVQLRLNYATKLELKLLVSYYNSNQSKFIRAMIHQHFTKLTEEDKRFNDFLEEFARNTERRKDD